jgi:ribonucleoside-triphosphate reductase
MEEIEGLKIDGDKILVFGKEHCDFCSSAKKILEHTGLAFEYVDTQTAVKDGKLPDEIRDNMDTTYFPNIFVPNNGSVLRFNGGTNFSEFGKFVRTNKEDLLQRFPLKENGFEEEVKHREEEVQHIREEIEEPKKFYGDNQPLYMQTTVSKIRKRDGSLVNFSPIKIRDAIAKAGKAIAISEGKDFHPEIADKLTDRVVGLMEDKFIDTTPTVEQTQDLVIRVIGKAGYTDVAKAYSVYREKHTQLREGFKKRGDLIRVVKDYLSGDDWRTKENANSGSITFSGLNAHISGEVLQDFALNTMYSPEVATAHAKGRIHIHDLSYPIVGYCAGWSIEQLIKRGFGEVPDRIQSSAPKHLETIILQMVNYIGTMQGEFAGAQAFSSVDTFLAPFVKADNLTFDEVKQYMQMLIYGLNVPSRWGWQAPFSNLTFDLTAPDDMKKKGVVANYTKADIPKRLETDKRIMLEKMRPYLQPEDFEKHKANVEKYLEARKTAMEALLDSKYGDYQKEMDMINMAFLEVMEKGDKKGRPFTFPIPTYNLHKAFNWDSKVATQLFRVTGKTGVPYFQNYLGSNLDPGAIRAMCCRLNLDQRELMNRPGNMWGPGDSTGSIGVVTLNMNRVGYEAKNEEEFFKILYERMTLAKEALEVKRKIVNRSLEMDVMPYTKSYLGSFDNHFSTIGINGMHECCVNFLDKGISTPEGKEFTIQVMNFMREKIKGFQQETGHLYNLEATPAESTAFRFGKLDKEVYGDRIHTSGEKFPFLTNSTQMNVDHTSDLWDALEHQQDIQPLYTGGTIFHTFLGEEIEGETCKRLVKKIASNTRLPYFSITPTFSVCNEHGRLKGRQDSCPHCGAKPEVYSRIVGYLRPLGSWNDGKGVEGEFKYRKTYVVAAD